MKRREFVDHMGIFSLSLVFPVSIGMSKSSLNEMSNIYTKSGIPLNVFPFTLRNVKLLEGPFKDVASHFILAKFYHFI